MLDLADAIEDDNARRIHELEQQVAKLQGKVQVLDDNNAFLTSQMATMWTMFEAVQLQMGIQVLPKRG